MEHIVKRHGHMQKFDERKVYASVYAAAINCHMKEYEAETLAEMVTKNVKKWIARTRQVTSDEIKKQIIEELHHEEVKVMYKHHLDVC